ncbi:3,5-dihydroxyphenylacetyl-CoA synthase DpgA [Micromonospora sagamiensis]|uniref:(3,5-dihydroxycyclohex-3-enyl)acetyl-CoA synthase n=1 Tax=Micromonospora sagamiensis TaxID=47875 RepID=A0A562WFK3_9ACTN|nr:3,5-dihydroxyphenylacetyl-CoA synthase DpgA [Micromonospora sagamiensis]TWJ29059.1 (3,5-dihydroxycyclohex-3-enyl)acetyl-CoA synthase [Micromonospora sagamiensis]
MMTVTAPLPHPGLMRTTPPPALESTAMPRILAVGTATPETAYSQRELVEILGIQDPRIAGIYLNSAIERRFLTLPQPDGSGVPPREDTGQLLAKHKTQGIAMGTRAVQECLKQAGADLSDVRYLCCVTSTGFLTPGFSALLIRELGLDRHTSRADIVGMGCNAGLNSLNVVSGWARAHPGELALMVCIEACSAAYVFDGTMRTTVVNSLFGDGSAAIAMVAGTEPDAATDQPPTPRVIDFTSCIIPEAVDAMRYDWDSSQRAFSFFLDPDIPYVVGAHARMTVDRLLGRAGLRQSDIAHWLVHSGGKKVIDAVGVNLGLTRYDLRHTTGVLRDYGNLSSGSFLFSYERLLQEGTVRPGEYGVLMTMGPGSTIETALVRW